MKLPNALVPMVVLAATSTGQSMVIGASLGATVQAAGDVDGDGVQDYMQAGVGMTTVYSGATGAVLLQLTNGPGVVVSALRGDVDGDGCDDLVHQNNLVSGATGAVIRPLPVDVVATCGAADLDADGFADIVARSGVDPVSNTYELRVLSGRTGVAIYVHSVFLPPLFPVNDIVKLEWVGDVDGDGFEDLALTREGGYSFVTDLQVLRGPAAIPSPWVHDCGTVTAHGDTDGDGRSEIITASAGALSGNPLQPVWGPWSGYAAAAGDMDGDGRTDLFLYSLAYSNYQLLSGATHAQLPGATPALGGVPPLVLGDIDGDGREECVDAGVVYEWLDPALPVTSRVVGRGAPGTTSTGRKPRLIARGHCSLGDTVFFDARGVVPGGITVMAAGASASVDLATVGAPGNFAYTTAQGVFVVATDGYGVAHHQATIPNLPALLGGTVSVQVAAVDPAANALGVVTSNALDLSVRD